MLKNNSIFWRIAKDAIKFLGSTSMANKYSIDNHLFPTSWETHLYYSARGVSILTYFLQENFNSKKINFRFLNINSLKLDF